MYLLVGTDRTDKTNCTVWFLHMLLHSRRHPVHSGTGMAETMPNGDNDDDGTRGGRGLSGTRRKAVDGRRSWLSEFRTRSSGNVFIVVCTTKIYTKLQPTNRSVFPFHQAFGELVTRRPKVGSWDVLGGCASKLKWSIYLLKCGQWQGYFGVRNGGWHKLCYEICEKFLRGIKYMRTMVGTNVAST